MTHLRSLFSLQFSSLLWVLLLSNLVLQAQVPKINTQTPLNTLEHSVWLDIQQTPMERVYDITQDEQGYLWIGSDRGLLRFDGSQLLKYNFTNTPLETENVTHVEVDTKGVVWLANRRGVYRLEDGIMTPVLKTDDTTLRFTNSLLTDKEGQLWLATFEGEIYYEEGGRMKLWEKDQSKARLLVKGLDNVIYARKNSEAGKLFTLDKETGLKPLPIKGIDGQNIRAINAKDGIVYWVNYKGQAWKWDGKAAAALNEVRYDRFLGQDLLIGAGGELWYADKELVRVLPNGQTDTFGPSDGLSADRIRGIMADRDGDIWIGTIWGMNRLANTPFSSLVKGDWPDIMEYCLVEVPGSESLLVGSRDKGLFLLKDGNLSGLNHPALNKTIRTLAFDKENHLLVGQPDGMFKFRYENGQLELLEKLVNDNVKYIHVTTQNDYLYTSGIGEQQQFHIIKNKTVTTLSTKGRYYLWLVDRPDGTVWVGTRKGLLLWDGEDLKETGFDDPFFSLYMMSYTPADEKGNWIGSYGTGIARVENDTVYRFNTSNGMPINQAFQMFITDPNSLWLFVPNPENGSVVRLTPNLEGNAPYLSQGMSYLLNQKIIKDEDGSAGYPTIIAQPRQGRVVILGEEGPFSFEPNKIPPVRPVLNLESAKLEDSVFDVGKNFTIKAGTRNIEFRYGAIDFKETVNQRFEHRLKGYDPNWQATGKRTTAYYSNLPAGEYEFQVRAQLANGEYIYSADTLQVTQQEYWFKKNWAILLYFLTLSGLTILLFQLRVRRIKQQRNTLRKQVAERTRELRDLNHDLGDLVEQRTEELTSSEERYRYALDASDDGIFDWDVPTDSIKFSPAIYTLLGYEPYSFEENRKLMLEKVHPDDQAGMDKLEVQLTEIKDTRYAKHEFRMEKKDGSLIWVRLKAKIFERSKRGNPIRIVGTISDITSEKQKTQEILDTVLRTEDLERSRISKDIHDGLQQTLMLAKMNLRALEGEVDKLPEEAAGKYKTGIDFLETSISESRAVAHDLMPKAIVDFGVIPAFESLIDHMDKATDKTQYHFYHNFKTSKLDNQQIEVTLYRILQECLNNIVKYAKATKVDVQLLEYQELYVLTIEDNGVGFDMQKVQTKDGMGFRSMKNRLDAIDGFMEVSSKPGKGVSIMVEINKQLK